ncbi:beta-L-arabinofuranosidase domain-containing protein, partial [Christiangramia aquimixticola]
IDTQFRQANKPWVSGHEEIELALVKLYKVTGEDRYLQLADWFLDQRGRGHGVGGIWDNPHWGPKYAQDDVPVKDQKEITGHAVRAMYLYTGA